MSAPDALGDALDTIGRRPTAPARPTASPDQLAAFLAKLQTRRRELVHHFAVDEEGDDAGDLGPAGGAGDHGLRVSELWPLMVVHAAIAAVEAEMAQGTP